MVGLGKEIENRDIDHAQVATAEDAQISRKGRWIAGNIGHSTQPPLGQVVRERTVEASARRIHHDQIWPDRSATAIRDPGQDIGGYERGVADAVTLRGLFGIADRARIEIDPQRSRKALCQRNGKEPRTAEEIPDELTSVSTVDNPLDQCRKQIERRLKEGRWVGKVVEVADPQPERAAFDRRKCRIGMNGSISGQELKRSWIRRNASMEQRQRPIDFVAADDAVVDGNDRVRAASIEADLAAVIAGMELDPRASTEWLRRRVRRDLMRTGYASDSFERVEHDVSLRLDLSRGVEVLKIASPACPVPLAGRIDASGARFDDVGDRPSHRASLRRLDLYDHSIARSGALDKDDAILPAQQTNAAWEDAIDGSFHSIAG